jgi:arabinogalactan oligomer/maltooligosaccharide transport system permease protein
MSLQRPSPARSALTHAFLIVLTMLTLYPVFWVVAMALTPQQGFSMNLLPIPTDPTLENFEAVIFRESPSGEWLFGKQLRNSVVVSVATTALGIFLACTAGYAFSRFRFPGRREGLMMFLVSQMFPGTMMLIPLYVILDWMGLLNQLAGLILVYSTTAIPFCVWMLKGYFDTIPKELEESAIIDGASQFTIFWQIILPLARPAIAVTALFSFMTAWNEFILATTFMNAEGSYTLPVTLQSYVGAYSTQWGYFAAGAIIVSVPVVALFFALQRYLVGGLTAGGVKG